MRVCTVCRHKKRDSIDRALIENQAVQFGLSHSAVDGHRQHNNLWYAIQTGGTKAGIGVCELAGTEAFHLHLG
jgi:hypothetical protein